MEKIKGQIIAQEFINIQREFRIASQKHLRTPWFRPFKAHRHLKEMQNATNKMIELEQIISKRG